jgi:predicted nucleic acid-binding protein
MARVITLDAGVLIAMLDEKNAHHEWAVRLLIDHSDARFMMPSITYAECLVRPAQKNLVEKFLGNIRGLAIEVTELTESTAVQLAQVRADSKLRMPDAVVLTTALMNGASVATTDEALAKAAQKMKVAAFKP